MNLILALGAVDSQRRLGRRNELKCSSSGVEAPRGGCDESRLAPGWIGEASLGGRGAILVSHDITIMRAVACDAQPMRGEGNSRPAIGRC